MGEKGCICLFPSPFSPLLLILSLNMSAAGLGGCRVSERLRFVSVGAPNSIKQTPKGALHCRKAQAKPGSVQEELQHWGKQTREAPRDRCMGCPASSFHSQTLPDPRTTFTLCSQTELYSLQSAAALESGCTSQRTERWVDPLCVTQEKESRGHIQSTQGHVPITNSPCSVLRPRTSPGASAREDK